jgi:beta-lactamase regulating signal transducer with metallopeptidase domain
MLGWSAQTTLIAMVLAAIAILASRSTRLGPAARHMLWLVVLIKLLTPPVMNWPWSPPKLWGSAEPAAVTPPAINVQNITQSKVATAPQVITPPKVTALQDWQGETSREPAPARVALPTPRIGWNFDVMRQGLFALWLGISAPIALWQIGRIVRFHRRLSWVIPAPEWLVEEVRNLSGQLGVRPPEIVVLPDLAPPMLWFLGRPKLILPGRLVSHADPLGLRAILAHELAHLRRGDHWVRRLDFFAGLIWWWNPVYWLTRERLGTEAELACDEWAIRTVPDGRVSYAEALLDVCRTLSTTRSPAPALGVAGAGRFLERRVNMILQDHAPSRISVPVLLGAGLLALLALPGWSAAGSVLPNSSDQAASTSKQVEHLLASATDAKAEAVVADDDDDDKDADAIKDQVAKELKKALGPGSDFEKEMKNLGVELTKELGPGSEFEKAMKTLGVELNKELGPGSEFEKEMKNLGTELQKQLGPGSDLAKQMENKGKAIDGKFGPGSDFEKRMKVKEKEIEEKFGPGSDFEKKMNRLGKEMEARFGEGSEFAEKMKQAKNDAKAAKESSETPSDKKKTSAKKKTTSKAQVVKALKAQIDELNAQLKKLQEADDEND